VAAMQRDEKPCFGEQIEGGKKGMGEERDWRNWREFGGDGFGDQNEKWVMATAAMLTRA
jgi:hypothetical protein